MWFTVALLFVVSFVAIGNAAPFLEDPASVFLQLINEFNGVYPKPVVMPLVRTNLTVDIGGLRLQTSGSHFVVDGTNFTMVGLAKKNVKAESISYTVDVETGGLKLSYRNLTVKIDDSAYNYRLEFASYSKPVSWSLEKRSNDSECLLSSGPFNEGLPTAKLQIMGEEPSDEHIRDSIKQLENNRDFRYNYFINGYLESVQRPLYLIVQENKMCDKIHS